MTTRPSLTRILSVDYLAAYAVLVPVVAWGFYLCVLTLTPGDAGAWRHPAAPALLTGLGLLVIAWRVTLIRAVFAAGVEAPATVQSVAHTRGGRVRVNFAYTYAGQAYTGGNTVSDSRVPVTLKPGDTVTVMVDPARPRVSLLRDAYL